MLDNVHNLGPGPGKGLDSSFLAYCYTRSKYKLEFFRLSLPVPFRRISPFPGVKKPASPVRQVIP